MAKEEIAYHEQFPLWPQCFQKLLLRQNASADGKGLTRRREHITANTKFDQKFNVSSLEEENRFRFAFSQKEMRKHEGNGCADDITTF